MSEYIKSPLNYTGGKYKLLNKILPLFPKKINKFVDLFCGGCNVAVNVIAKEKICNDLESHVIDFYENIKLINGEEANKYIERNIDKYGLSKTNQEGFLKCREDYNANKTWDMFYSVITHAFNYQIRYNKNGDYNMPFGKDRSSYNKSLQQKFINFVDVIDGSYTFTNKDFRKANLDNLSQYDLVYCDPPYLITTASYNENGGWTEKDEHDLLELLDKLNDKGVKFALSNVLTHKGKRNEILIKWCEDNKDKYIVHHLDHSYSNCNYHDKTGNSGESDEVIICNYHVCGDCSYYGECSNNPTECEYTL